MKEESILFYAIAIIAALVLLFDFMVWRVG